LARAQKKGDDLSTVAPESLACVHLEPAEG
jgi:hypothetical protein